MKKSVVTMYHLLFWIFTSLLVIVVYNFLSGLGRILGGGKGPDMFDYLTLILIVLSIGGCIFYASYFSLNYFIKRRNLFIPLISFYLIAFIVLTILMYNWGVTDYVFEGLMFILPVLYFNLSGFLFKTIIEWIKDRKIKAELEKKNLQTELALLKSQISPHFLFNTLNNIDVLITKDAEKASVYLKKLSDILRFMLYDTKGETVPLSLELEYIEKYIELQRIRTSNESYINLSINGNANESNIAPMVFIPFVENAFKHASNKKTTDAIEIKFDISSDVIKFSCENYKGKNISPIQKQSGLGINLIEQRLNLLYKERHTLKIEDSDEKYVVTLTIQLNED